MQDEFEIREAIRVITDKHNNTHMSDEMVSILQWVLGSLNGCHPVELLEEIAEWEEKSDSY